MFLHEAIAEVLRRNGGGPMSTRAIAHEIAARGLYRRRDGAFPHPSQIAARANNYPRTFERVAAGVRLRGQPERWRVARVAQ